MDIFLFHIFFQQFTWLCRCGYSTLVLFLHFSNNNKNSTIYLHEESTILNNRYNQLVYIIEQIIQVVLTLLHNLMFYINIPYRDVLSYRRSRLAFQYVYFSTHKNYNLLISLCITHLIKKICFVSRPNRENKIKMT